jgi:hypothetical protein
MSLDELLREAGETLDQLSEVHARSLIPELAADVRRHRPRALALSVSVIVVALLAVVTGVRALDAKPEFGTSQREVPTSQASSTTSTEVPSLRNEQLDRLLFPTESAEGLSIAHASEKPDRPMFSVADTVVSTTGGTFTFTATENVWGDLPAGRDQREVNGRRYAVTLGPGVTEYVTLDRCVQITIVDQRPQPTAWDSEATAFMSGIEIVDTNVSVTLPTDWTTVGGGSANAIFSLRYAAELAGVSREVALVQTVFSPPGALLASGRWGNVSAIEFRGTVAWTMAPEESAWRYLAWGDPSGSAVIGAPNVTVEDLKILASMLEPGHRTEWQSLLGQSDKDETGPATTVSSAAPCGLESVNVHR